MIDTGTCCGSSAYKWGVEKKYKRDCALEPTKSQCEQFAKMVDGNEVSVTEMNGDWQTGTCFKEGSNWSYNTANTPKPCSSTKMCACFPTGIHKFIFYIVQLKYLKRLL